MDTLLQSAREDARQARRSIEHVRRQLLSPLPQTLCACTDEIGSAIQALERLQAFLSAARAAPKSPQTQGIRVEIGRLKVELGHVSALLTSAWAFYEACWQGIGAGDDQISDGYPSRDKLARPEAPRRFIVHG